MPESSYEVVVTRHLTNRFVVKARSRTEAAMQVGQILAGTDPWLHSTETETSRQMRAPALTEAPAPGAVAEPLALE